MMTPARLSLRSALLVVVLAAAQLLAVGAVVGGDWGAGEAANFKKMAIKSELEARAALRKRVELGQSGERIELAGAKLKLEEKLEFDVVGRTVSKLREDIINLKQKNAERRAAREQMRAAAGITEQKILKGEYGFLLNKAVGKDVLDGAMAAAMNDISQEMIKNGTNGTVVDEAVLERELMQKTKQELAILELAEGSGASEIAHTHNILMMGGLVVLVAVVGYVFKSNPAYFEMLKAAAAQSSDAAAGAAAGFSLPRSTFDATGSRTMFSKMRARYTGQV